MGRRSEVGAIPSQRTCSGAVFCDSQLRRWIRSAFEDVPCLLLKAQLLLVSVINFGLLNQLRWQSGQPRQPLSREYI